jgi:hypothetical protein
LVQRDCAFATNEDIRWTGGENWLHCGTIPNHPNNSPASETAAQKRESLAARLIPWKM